MIYGLLLGLVLLTGRGAYVWISPRRSCRWCHGERERRRGCWRCKGDGEMWRLGAQTMRKAHIAMLTAWQEWRDSP